MCDADAVNPISLRRGDMSLKGGTVGSQARSQRHAWTCTEDGLEFRDLRELQLHMKRKVRPRRDVHSPRSRDGGEGECRGFVTPRGHVRPMRWTPDAGVAAGVRSIGFP